MQIATKTSRCLTIKIFTIFTKIKTESLPEILVIDAYSWSKGGFIFLSCAKMASVCVSVPLSTAYPTTMPWRKERPPILYVIDLILLQRPRHWCSFCHDKYICISISWEIPHGYLSSSSPGVNICHLTLQTLQVKLWWWSVKVIAFCL